MCKVVDCDNMAVGCYEIWLSMQQADKGNFELLGSLIRQELEAF